MEACYTNRKPVKALAALTAATACTVALTCFGAAAQAQAATNIPVPREVSVKAAAAGFTVDTTWGKKANPKKVQVRYSTVKSMKDAEVKTYKVKAKAKEARNLVKTISAKAGTKYYVQVRLKKNGKAGEWSDVRKATTGYKIAYKLRGGTQNAKQKDYYVTSKGYALKAPTRSGYTFDGWYTNSNTPFGYDIVKIKKGTTGKVTVYAKWLPNTYTIRYVANGGKLPSGVKTSYSTGTAYKLPTPTRVGYTFAGWYTDSACTVKAGSIKRSTVGNKVYYAKWVSNTASGSEDEEVVSDDGEDESDEDADDGDTETENGDDSADDGMETEGEGDSVDEE